MAGRLEGTHTFPFDHLPQTRARSRLLDEVDVAAQQRAQAIAQRVQSAEMIEPASGKPDAGTHRQVHIRSAGGVATRH